MIVKGLPALPAKVVEKAQDLEFVEMEDFLPAPRALRLAEQGKGSLSLQESLVGALTEFHASRQHRDGLWISPHGHAALHCTSR